VSSTFAAAHADSDAILFLDHFSYCWGFSGRADVNEAMFLISRSQLVDEGRMRFRLRESLS